ncbi:hypothetical protein GCM10010515_25660 [Streptomyces fructofermentans]|uniref:Uncharacterized protein n=1 Tax=Streptomyces fructofermentans TaxID=152141 RepID=A0A918KAX8_9ACTN|nr:hypothetical protein GCM10010515_25660 [Streptomyces fructofermentans]
MADPLLGFLRSDEVVVARGRGPSCLAACVWTVICRTPFIRCHHSDRPRVEPPIGLRPPISCRRGKKRRRVMTMKTIIDNVCVGHAAAAPIRGASACPEPNRSA